MYIYIYLPDKKRKHYDIVLCTNKKTFRKKTRLVSLVKVKNIVFNRSSKTLYNEKS